MGRRITSFRRTMSSDSSAEQARLRVKRRYFAPSSLLFAETDAGRRRSVSSCIWMRRCEGSSVPSRRRSSPRCEDRRAKLVLRKLAILGRRWSECSSSLDIQC